MSRYKEERASEILAINLTKMVDREEQSYSSIEEMKKLPEWDCTISAMCQLAEEVENTCNMELYVIKLYLSKLIEKEQYSKDFHIKFLLKEANKCSLTLYTKEQVEELLQEKSNIINSLCRQIQTLEKLMLDMIEINKVEELLQKQRELCYNSIYWKDDVDKDSILNAKLEI